MQKNDKVGRLTLIRRFRRMYGKNKTTPFWVWVCECECGESRKVREDHLRKAAIRSCGCLNQEKRGASQRVHGESWKKSVEYQTWCGIRNRCRNKNDEAYARYGGRGIRVCDRWLGPTGYAAFLKDMGRRPASCSSIDRIDNDGDYSPENCRWATDKIQNRNTRVTKHLTYQGETRPLSEWAEIKGILAATIHNRSYLGWSVEDALTIPVKDTWAHRRSRFANSGRGW